MDDALDLDELERLHQAATPGQWFATDAPAVGLKFYVASCCDHDQPIVAACREVTPDSDRHNAVLIAAIRNALPALLAAAREREELHEKAQRRFMMDQLALDGAMSEVGRCMETIDTLRTQVSALTKERAHVPYLVGK